MKKSILKILGGIFLFVSLVPRSEIWRKSFEKIRKESLFTEQFTELIYFPIPRTSEPFHFKYSSKSIVPLSSSMLSEGTCSTILVLPVALSTKKYTKEPV